MATPQTIAFHTLGCKLNFSETSTIRRKFEDLGYFTTDWDRPADIYVLNTCSVTDFADRKCRYAVRKALRQRPDARIIVIGCYAQLKPEEIAQINGVDLVLGAAEKFNIHHYVEGISKSSDKGVVRAGQISEINSFEEAFSFGDRTRTFLKVQDGCDYKCSFCTIPLARGKSRSSSIDSVVSQAAEIGEKGGKEIVLTGVNIGDFGKSNSSSSNDKETFLGLIMALDRVKGIERFRISSIEPNLCSNEIISFVANSGKFVPHFHIPLQSGSADILKSMRRRYTKELYRSRIEHIKKVMPHACIGVDVMVGFPGETEKHFAESMRFLKDLDVSYFHVFTYSERPNTVANQFAQTVDMGVRRNRNEILRQLSTKKKREFYRQHIETVRPVLIEQGGNDGVCVGFTDNYIKVVIETPEAQPRINKVDLVRLNEMTDDGIFKGQFVLS